MRDYFCGWYYKCQSDKKTISIIVAYHIINNNKSCSIQIISNDGAWNITYPYDQFKLNKKEFCVDLENNHFDKNGITLNIDAPGINVTGNVKFGEFSKIKYDIMGPFKFVPFMECRHSVVSMKHNVTGTIVLNGETFEFNNDLGYIEGDRGYSFPKVYSWTHCFLDDDGSLMLSVADIPIGKLHFTGIIGVIKIGDVEHRIATYLGAKALEIKDGKIVIKQNKKVLTAQLIEKKAHPLFAPVNGDMIRTIKESASCIASYKYEIDGKVIVDTKSDKASFEYEFEQLND